VSSLGIGFISFACIFGGAMLGMALRRLLPAHHLRDDSKDTIKLGAGLIATLAALVRGLLVGSAKSSFDAASAAITQSATKILVLDSVLARYGDEARPAREQLRRNVAAGIEMIWPEQKTGISALTAFERANGVELLQDKLQALKPDSDLKGSLRSRALGLNHDLLQARWLVIEQQQAGLPVPLLVVLVF
jgi:hypothetical protein